MSTALIDTKWPEMKLFVDEKGLSIQWLELEGNYYLRAYDGPFAVACILPIDDPKSAEVVDFETNYKPTSNKRLDDLIRPYKQVLGTDSYNISPRAMKIDAPKAIDAENPTVSIHDKQLDSALSIRGGILYSQNATMGDQLQFQIVDKDDVLGFGATPENPIIIKNYVPEWYVMPNEPNELMDVSVGTLPVAGLYLRVIYTATGTIEDVIAILNIISYEVDPL